MNGIPPNKSKLKPITKTSLSEKIADQIIDLISKGELAPGQRLPSERELCKQLGVGRSSLREAMRCLSIMGVLDVRVGEGTSVASDWQKFLEQVIEWRVVTAQHNLEELYEVRLALEVYTAAHAATRGTSDQLLRLQQIVAEMPAALANGERLAELDLKFHLTLAEASKNRLLIGLLSLIRGQLQEAVSKSISIPGGAELALEQHRLILEAIGNRRPDTAEAHMRSHVETALMRYREAEEKHKRSISQSAD